ncbi:ABC transporter ATP-binding protein, partial [Pseudomonas aeruginosa]
DLLYPWLTVEENVALGSRLRGEVTDRAWVAHLLERVGLAAHGRSLPAALSGGMRQRAAIARTLYERQPIVLMDEPFSALDAITRLALQDVLRQLIAQEKPTVLLVTHDVDEALFLADRIVVFSPRPARVLREFTLAHRAKSHDLSDLAAEKREILRLLGIAVGGSSAHADLALAA